MTIRGTAAQVTFAAEREPDCIKRFGSAKSLVRWLFAEAMRRRAPPALDMSKIGTDGDAWSTTDLRYALAVKCLSAAPSEDHGILAVMAAGSMSDDALASAFSISPARMRVRRSRALHQIAQAAWSMHLLVAEPSDDVVTTREAADRLRVSTQAMDQRAVSGSIHALSLGDYRTAPRLFCRQCVEAVAVAGECPVHGVPDAA